MFEVCGCLGRSSTAIMDQLEIAWGSVWDPVGMQKRSARVGIWSQQLPELSWEKRFFSQLSSGCQNGAANSDPESNGYDVLT